MAFLDPPPPPGRLPSRGTAITRWNFQQHWLSHGQYSSRPPPRHLACSFCFLAGSARGCIGNLLCFFHCAVSLSAEALRHLMRRRRIKLNMGIGEVRLVIRLGRPECRYCRRCCCCRIRAVNYVVAPGASCVDSGELSSPREIHFEIEFCLFSGSFRCLME